MKQSLWHRIVFFAATAAAGIAALWLQSRAMAAGYDEKGLFVWRRPETAALLAVCAVYALGLGAFCAARIRSRGVYGQVFDRCWLRGAVMALAGGMVALDLCYALDPLPPALLGLGLLAAAGMAAAGVCVGLGRRPSPWFHGAVCVFALVRLLIGYRRWGASAHLEQFVFPLLAGVALMLYSFHRCAADAGTVMPRKMALSAGACIVCSMAALATVPDRVFYLAVIGWTAGSMCNLAKARKEPA